MRNHPRLPSRQAFGQFRQGPACLLRVEVVAPLHREQLLAIAQFARKRNDRPGCRSISARMKASLLPSTNRTA